MSQESTDTPITKRTVTVTADDGVTFAGVHYAKGKSIQCTADQEEILKKHNVIKS